MEKGLTCTNGEYLVVILLQDVLIIGTISEFVNNAKRSNKIIKNVDM